MMARSKPDSTRSPGAANQYGADPGIPAPQPGARKEMPSSPPRNKYIFPALIAIAVFGVLVLIFAYT